MIGRENRRGGNIWMRNIDGRGRREDGEENRKGRE